MHLVVFVGFLSAFVRVVAPSSSFDDTCSYRVLHGNLSRFIYIISVCFSSSPKPAFDLNLNFIYNIRVLRRTVERKTTCIKQGGRLKWRLVKHLYIVDKYQNERTERQKHKTILNYPAKKTTSTRKLYIM